MGTHFNTTAAKIFLQPNQHGTRPIDSPRLMELTLKSNGLALAHIDDALKIAISIKNYSVIRLLLDKYHASPSAANTPDDKGITLIHRWARKSESEFLRLFLKHIKKEDIVLNRKAFFTSKTRDACFSQANLSAITDKSYESFAYPFVVCEYNCETLVAKKHGPPLVLENINAKDVVDRLNALALQKTGHSQQSAGSNTFEVFASPGHFFFRLIRDDGSDSEYPFNQTLGFHPTDRPVGTPLVQFDREPHETGRSFIGKFKRIASRILGTHGELISDAYLEQPSYENNYPVLTFYISDSQAQEAAEQIIRLETECRTDLCVYKAVGGNCINAVEKICGRINCLSFIPDEVLQHNLLGVTNLAYTSARIGRFLDAGPTFFPTKDVPLTAITVAMPPATIALMFVGVKIVKSIYRRTAKTLGPLIYPSMKTVSRAAMWGWNVVGDFCHKMTFLGSYISQYETYS